MNEVAIRHPETGGTGVVLEESLQVWLDNGWERAPVKSPEEVQAELDDEPRFELFNGQMVQVSGRVSEENVSEPELTTQAASNQEGAEPPVSKE